MIEPLALESPPPEISAGYPEFLRRIREESQELETTLNKRAAWNGANLGAIEWARCPDGVPLIIANVLAYDSLGGY
jgi:hypothetical protein